MEKNIKINNLNIKYSLSPNKEKCIKKNKSQINYEFINENKKNKKTFSINYKNNNNLNLKKLVFKINLKLNNVIYLLLTILFANSIFTKNIILRKYKNKDSEIKLKIKGTGEQNILAKNFTDIPNEILVNGVVQKNRGNSVYNLSNTINIIKMKWNYTIASCNGMFSE